jgi:hypothetical protein
MSNFDQYLRVGEKNLATDGTAQAQWAEKKWVWVEDKDEGYVAGTIVKETDTQVAVQINDIKVKGFTFYDSSK